MIRYLLYEKCQFCRSIILKFIEFIRKYTFKLTVVWKCIFEMYRLNSLQSSRYININTSIRIDIFRYKQNTACIFCNWNNNVANFGSLTLFWPINMIAYLYFISIEICFCRKFTSVVMLKDRHPWQLLVFKNTTNLFSSFYTHLLFK